MKRIASLLFFASSALSAQDTAMQARGKVVMGVDQYSSIHLFDDRADGGRIELQRDRDDSLGTAVIRAHIRDIAAAFHNGDFRKPGIVHMKMVPGSGDMARLRAHIRYVPKNLPRGAELLIVTKDTAAIRAVHEFLAFQRDEHHAEGHDMHHP